MKKLTLRKVAVSVVIFMLMITYVAISEGSTASAASSYPYMIKVNKKMNTVTVYGKDENGKYTKPVKAMVCSTGRATPLGTFGTKIKYRWKVLLEDVWGQYSTRITGDVLFHSVYYMSPKNPATLSVSAYNRLGTTASHGCIRLTVADAKWIYDNCPVGTKVTIYNASKPGPLGKPTAIKLSSPRWDPTDTGNSKNPYNKRKPIISGAKNQKIEYASKVNLLKGVTAKNSTGFNATKLIKVKGKVNSKKPGKYKITYTIKDEIGRKATKKVTFTVLEDRRKAQFVGVSNKVYPASYEERDINSYATNGVSARFAGKKLSSKVAPISYKTEVVKNNDSIKKYKVTYYVTAPKTKLQTVKSIYIVVDKKAPTISNTKDLYITAKEFNQLKKNLNSAEYFDLTLKDNRNKLENITFEASLSEEAAGSKVYTLTYTAKDQPGNVTSEKVKVFVLKQPSLVVANPTFHNVSELTEENLRSHVSVMDNGVDLSHYFRDQVSVTVTQLAADGTLYQVDYKLDMKNFGEIVTSAVYQLQ